MTPKRPQSGLNRVWLGFGILGAAAFLIAAVSIFCLLSLTHRRDLFEPQAEKLVQAAQLNLAVERTVAAKRAYLLTDEDRYLEEMQARRGDFRRLIENLVRVSKSEEERDFLDRLLRLESDHQRLFERVLAMQKAGVQKSEFIRFLGQEMEPRRAALGDAAREYNVFLQERHARMESESDRATFLAVLIVVGTTFFILLMAAGLAVGVGRRLLSSQRFLAQNQERLNDILQSAMDAIITIGMDQRIVLFNEAAEKIFRIPAEKALGEPIDRFIPERFRSRHSKHVENFGKTGETTRSMGRLGTLYGRRVDGEEFPLEATISQTRAGGEKFFTVILRDITERLRSEEALRYQSHLTKTITDSTSVALFLLDAEGRPNYMNPAAQTLTGYRLEEMRGDSFGSILRMSQALIESIADLRPLKNHEDTLARKDGVRLPVLLTMEPLRQDGKGQGAVAEIIDLSERKKAKAALRESEEKLQQSQKMDAVGQLAGGIAHDFNNLLTAINGFTDLCLVLTEKGSTVHENLIEVKRAGERAAELTRQLLAYSRKQVIRPRVLNLNQVVDNVSRLLKRLIGENIALSLKLEPELGLIRMDSGQLEQIILNLALNSRDSMPQGGELIIETHNTELLAGQAGMVMDTDPGAYVELVVTDTGSGISPEIKAHVFEPFFTTKEVGKGTGLGLASIYGIVKQAGGTIILDSEPGQGTTMKALFPRIQQEFEAAAPLTDRKVESVQGNGEAILLVEDEETVRHFTRKVLESLGYAVLEAGNAREGLQVFLGHGQEIRLLISDVVMPGLSGPDLAEDLRRRKPDLKVLFMTGYTQESTERLENSMAGQHLVRKPFSPNQLAELVKKILTPASMPVNRSLLRKPQNP